MKTCKWCGAWSLFHTLSDNGLCRKCNLLVVNRVQIHTRQLVGLLHSVKASDEPEEQLRLCDQIIDEAQRLHEFEKLSIPTVQPHPEDLIRRVSEYYDQLSNPEDSSALDDLTSTEGISLGTNITIAEEMDPLGTWSKRVRQ
jgi:hypothetical protein